PPLLGVLLVPPGGGPGEIEGPGGGRRHASRGIERHRLRGRRGAVDGEDERPVAHPSPSVPFAASAPPDPFAASAPVDPSDPDGSTTTLSPSRAWATAKAFAASASGKVCVTRPDTSTRPRSTSAVERG